MGETREEYLLRTSEMYRRLRSRAMPERASPAIDLPRDATPPDMARALPRAVAQAPRQGPGFVRRLVTQRPGGREIVLLVFLVLALWFGLR
jgi:hypothetical protein